MLLWLIYLVFLENHISAQKIYFSKEKYNLLEPVELIVESSKLLNIQSENIPKIDGLELIGNSHSYKKIQHQSVYLYYFIFKAQKTGNIQIPSFYFHSNQSKLEFKSKTINIYSTENFFQNKNLNKETWKLNAHDVILEIQFNKNHAFVGEQINQNVTLYIKDNLIDKIFFEPQAVQNLLQNIKNTQFWEENLDSLPFQNVSYEFRNGIKYQKYLLNHSFLFAFFPGSIHYESVPFKIKKKTYLTNEIYENPLEEVTIYSNSLDLTISEVPVPNLLTGIFNIKYLKPPSKIKLGDKIDYKFTISGNGNLNTIKPNLPKLNKSCDIFEQNHNSKQYLFQNELYYSLEFEYHIIPNDTGNYKISSISFPYFNTKTKRKEFLEIPEISFYVEKNEIKFIDNHNISNVKTESRNLTGWNIWGLSILVSIILLFLWFIYKELIN